MADLAADMSVTRAGFPNMAVTAAYAGPFFNMCIGIGLSFLTKVRFAAVGLPFVTISNQHGRRSWQPTMANLTTANWTRHYFLRVCG